MNPTVSQLSIARTEMGEDARVKKTLAKIQRAFHDLILLNDYDEITVAELCEAARIGRKTFYTHFSSLDDLMEKQLEQMTEEYADRIKNLRVPDDLREITRQFYLYSEDQGLYYEKLICSDAWHGQGVRLLMRFVAGAWENSSFCNSLSASGQELLLCFIYNVGSSIYRQWIREGRKEPLEKMVDVTTSLLTNGISGFQRCQII